MTARPLPGARNLSRSVHDGWACVWCGQKLTRGAVSAGIARGSSGAHLLDVEVFACPGCADGNAPERTDQQGDDQ